VQFYRAAAADLLSKSFKIITIIIIFCHSNDDTTTGRAQSVPFCLGMLNSFEKTEFIVVVVLILGLLLT
jgi:hypothetical protein